MAESMQIVLGGARLEVVRGDITKQELEAIVNAANNALSPGGGVSGAIHRAAGPNLWKECKQLGGCPTGEARLTRGYDLKARYVIHTVGPVYKGREKDRALLASCYRNSLRLAVEHGIDSVAFPAISTGVFGYPLKAAADVALSTVSDFLRTEGRPALVRFVLWGDEALDVHLDALRGIRP
ncbi:MAG: O-acetyl-ADP-ribose deacetylase [Candidatus Thermoplasmatota archaeon]